MIKARLSWWRLFVDIRLPSYVGLHVQLLLTADRLAMLVFTFRYTRRCSRSNWDLNWDNCYNCSIVLQDFGVVLPQKVLAPGTPIGPVTEKAAAEFGLRRDCQIIAGTTDSVAAFLAADTREEGMAVTSLGSTLAVKLLSKNRIEEFSCGVYSQRLEDVWLVGKVVCFANHPTSLSLSDYSWLTEIHWLLTWSLSIIKIC